jgi:hypothetical protein
MLNELERVNKKIVRLAKRENRLYYFGRFFPSTKFIKVMFVAERPTIPRPRSLWNPRDNFYLSSTDRRFVKILNDYGLGGSYITDIVKSCAEAGSDIDDINHYIFLKQEIEIIKPKIIVALGNKAFNKLQEIKEEINLTTKLEKIWHPSYPRRIKNGWNKYRNQIKRIKRLAVLIN